MASNRTVSSIPRNEFARGFFAVLGADEGGSGEEDEKSPLGRVLDTARMLFPNNDRFAQGFVARFRAAVAILEREEFERWSRKGQESGDTFHVHPALLCACAEVKLNKNGKFPLRLLWKTATRLESGEFADWAWPEG